MDGEVIKCLSWESGLRLFDSSKFVTKNNDTSLNFKKSSNKLYLNQYLRILPTAFARLKSNRDLFMFNSNTTHLQSANMAHISLKVLDLDFVNQTRASTYLIAKSWATILMICLWISLWIKET